MGEVQDDASTESYLVCSFTVLFLYQSLLTIIVWNGKETASYRMCNLRHKVVIRRLSLLDSNPECNVFVMSLLEEEH